jgi:cyclopropane fatty-acyl-phospholipid synthase-like methyltransferase
VHLALGDAGLQAFFSKVHDFLKPGGHFVLEYSHFPSYKRKKGLNELYRENYKKNIKIDPLSFPSLLKFMGF